MTEPLRLRDLRYPQDGSVVSVDELVLVQGESLVLFGPNGAGKSSLIRLIAGTLGDGPALPAAYLPQRPYMFRGSAQLNLTLGLKASEAERALALAAELGITHLLDKSASSLSGGERQRVALARTLSSEADLVLLDEPLAPVDLRDRGPMASVITAALSQRRALIVSHDRESVASLGNRVAVMIDGSVRQTGGVAEVFSLPSDDVVASVVGVSNVLAGTVGRVDPPLVEVSVGPLRVWALGDQQEGGQVKLLFGAETVSIHVGRAPSGSPRNVWTGVIEDVRASGRLVELVVDAGTRIVALVTPGSFEAMGLAVGDTVRLAVKATAVRAVAGGGN